MVIKQVKRWFRARANAARWRDVADWAEARGAKFAVSRDGHGFMIDHAKAQAGGLRVEWGASQRSYIPGKELRMRCEVGLQPELQMLIMSRDLMETLERAVFEAYTDTLKTRVDTDTPEEMRWLVMFTKLKTIPSKLVRERFGALAINQEVAATWLDGPLSEVLAQASQDLLPEARPFVLMSQRGNMYLRVAMDQPKLEEIQSFMMVLEAACRDAQRVNTRLVDGGPWPTTSSVTWQSSTPEDGTPQP